MYKSRNHPAPAGSSAAKLSYVGAQPKTSVGSYVGQRLSSNQSNTSGSDIYSFNRQPTSGSTSSGMGTRTSSGETSGNRAFIHIYSCLA